MKKLKISTKTIKTILAILIGSLLITLALVTDSKHLYGYRILFGIIAVVFIAIFLYIFTIPEKKKQTEEKTPIEWGNWADAKSPEGEQKKKHSKTRGFLKKEFKNHPFWIIIAIIAGPIGFLLYLFISKDYKKFLRILFILGIITILFIDCSKKVYRPSVQYTLKDTLSEVSIDYKEAGKKPSRFELPEENLSIIMITFFPSVSGENHFWILVKNPEGIIYNEKFSIKNLFEFYGNNGREYFYHIFGKCYVHHSLKENCIYFKCILEEERYEIKYSLNNLGLTPIGSINKYLDPEELRVSIKH